MSSRPMFYIIDGHAVAYRQFFGLPLEAFSTKSGEPTNATYGFTRVLLDLLQKTRPDYIAVSFDMGLSERDTIYSEYKGTREKMPSELAQQLPRINEVVEALNIPVLALDGYEADDVIGTVTQQAEAAGVHVRIVTGDRDLLQLLTEHVTVQLPSRSGPDEVYDVARFTEKYQVRPDQWVDMKALMGDSSDNIPGIRGIGEKTALKLLTAHETLDGIYANLDQIKGSVHKKLDGGRDLAYLSQKLAQILHDVPITLDLDACVTHDYDAARALDLFRELEFRSFTNRLLEAQQPEQASMFDDFEDEDFSPPPRASDEVEMVIVRDKAGLDTLVEILNGAEAIVWDVESTSVDQMSAELVGIALAVDGETGYYVPVAHGHGQQLDLQTVIDALREPMTNPNIAKYAHNAAYDLVVTARHGLQVIPVEFDSMIAEWLLDPTSKFLGLKNFAQQYFNIFMTPITDLIGTGKKQKTIDQISIDQVAPYAAADAAITYRAVAHLRPKLEKENLLGLYNELELPLIPVIVTMEQAGVALDVRYLSEMSDRLGDELARLEEHIFNLSDGYGEFNVNSPKQLNEVLFDQLNLPTTGLRKTSHGFSTNAATLQQLKDDTGHPIVDAILEYRELTKLKGTYVDALPELINPMTGRLHTSYNQTGTTTGRLSSSNPNLQNIPIRTEIGREVRRAFIAPKGKTLLAVDYSQIELRVMAHVSQDETLLQAFADGQDIHAATAAAVYDIDLDAVTYEQRSFAKRVNFGLIYGMGAFRLARDSDLSLAEANAFIETYFERLPGVKAYMDRTRREALENEQVSTLLGRVRQFNGLANMRNRNAREGQLRAAINMPIQGTAADIMKRAMIDLHAALKTSDLNAIIILQVHDELMLEVPDNELMQTRDLVVKLMEAAYPLDTPLRANAEAGANWRDMEPV